MTLESKYGLHLQSLPLLEDHHVAAYGPNTVTVFAALSGAELLHNLDRLAGRMVCVFDRPDKLVRLSGVQPVDFFFDAPGLYRFRPFTTAALAPARFPKPAVVALRSKPREVMREMLDASDDGVLNGILTFIYTIKNTKTRKDVTEIVYPWFFRQSQSMTKLFNQLAAQFPSVDFDPMAELFLEKADVVNRIRAAVSAYSLKRHPDFRAYCEIQDVPFYDAHYLVKVVRGKKKAVKT